ncbi:hypothetical protein STAS_13825 [Striga asiatica]|uniref:cysteine dioxygenase n=1 Tax=Striga asiatica TaxID=4170 RepID=A0A5A7PX16_STRAF|nr:hypothetical protein STAS_13825 [Striga asiatica]
MRISGSKSSDESKKSKRKQKKWSPVQRLYDTCKEVFADSGPGIIPSPEKVQKLAAVLDGMTQEDVGLSPNMPFFSSKRAPTISYMHLHECDQFSIGIFCLPPTSVIPLHNHPGMTVFGKLLFGTMHIKAYDWFNGASVNTSALNNGLRMAKLKVDSNFTAPCRTSILYPADGGNMHCFTAKTACAVLDVLGPPYCDPDGRHCQYYFDYPFSKFPVEGLLLDDEDPNGCAWLKERDKPEELCVIGVPYNGPKIIKK